MNRVTCSYYLTGSGRSPVEEFIDSLVDSTQEKFFILRELLERYGHRLAQPYAKYTGDSIFELRFSGKEGAVRVLYFFFHQDKAIFTNGFIKKTNKLPGNEKDLAIRRRNDFLNR